MKKTFLKAAIPTLAMLLVAIMALTGTTYAWFTVNNTATASGIDVTIQSAGGLLISTDGTTWGSEIDLNMDGHNFHACSTNGLVSSGKLNFWTAELSSTNNANLKAGSVKSIASTNSAGILLVQTIYVKNENKSKALNVTFEGTDMTGDGAEAGRIAVIDTTSVKLLYSKTAKTTLGLNGTQIASDIAVTATGNHAASYNTTSDGSTKSFSVPANDQVSFTVYFWLEGQDPACTNNIAEKTISASIKFKATEAS